MGFKQLQTKVQQAEAALEARERGVTEQWRRLTSTWKAAWTPGRIVIAGLAGGFLVGRAQPLRAAARSGQWMQLVTMLSGLFAGGSAQVAAEHAEEAADTAETVADVVAPATPGAAATAPSQAEVSANAHTAASGWPEPSASTPSASTPSDSTTSAPTSSRS